MSDIELKPCPRCQSDYVSVECSLGIDGDGLNRHFYYGFCGFCHMAGPDVNNEEGEGIAEEQAAEAWNALPRHLHWTTEPPTEPDFYWHRDEGILSIAYIFGDTQDNLLCHFAGEEHPTPLILITGEWAGPIPEPQEQP